MKHSTARPLVRLRRALGALLGVAALALMVMLAAPETAFAYHVSAGRLSLYADTPFDPASGRAVLAEVERRLRTSPIDDGARHKVFITNTHWRRTLAFNVSGGAAGINYYPLTRNVFIRKADIAHDRVFGASGRAAAPPRTLAYYAAHEITHSLTGERRGPQRLWNRSLPQWVREGYADYVGFGGEVDAPELYRRYRAGDPVFDFPRSGQYARFRLLAAYFLKTRGWSVDRLLDTRLSQAQAEAMMRQDLG